MLKELLYPKTCARILKLVVLEICSFANTSFISTKKLTTQQRHFQANTLLHPCAYVEECPLCNKRRKDIYAHIMITCPTTKVPKKKLQLKLALYKYPAEKLPPNKASLIVLAQGNTTLKKCFLTSYRTWFLAYCTFIFPFAYNTHSNYLKISLLII